LHYAVVERWSREASPLHARDARVKILALLIYLVVLATTPHPSLWIAISYLLVLLFCVLLARLPLHGIMLRAGVVLPFTLTFAAVSLFAGDAQRALTLVEKSYLSALAALLLVSVTPLPSLLHGVESLGAPRFLVLIVQFLYRYLFVVMDQGRNMILAAHCRGYGAASSPRGERFRAAAGALAVLFARSHARSEGIYRAMLSRGFDGIIRPVSPHHLEWADIVFLLSAVAILAGIRTVGAHLFG